MKMRMSDIGIVNTLCAAIGYFAAVNIAYIVNHWSQIHGLWMDFWRAMEGVTR
jgi:hypothetical protein